MKRSFLIVILSLALSGLKAQSYTELELSIEPFTINNAPGVQSFAWGTDNEGRWVIIGGRIDGLHQRQPFASFVTADNNTSIFVIDPQSSQVWSTSVNGLSTSIKEQFQSTNMEFVQNDSFLYIVGGYGYSATSADHITYPYLNRVNLDLLSRELRNGGNIANAILQIQNTSFAVTGGHLGFLNDTFYLAGGQYFEGRYNPMGPDHGPGFIQQYTEEIRIFTLNETANNISLDHYSTFSDAELHRRDYNMTPQIFPDGHLGFTMFSGVFKVGVDLPHLNMVNFDHNGFQVINEYNQLLSQYHSAKLPAFDSVNNVMHTFFFGGMSQFTLDTAGNLVEDQDVPFVKTISRMTRFSNDSMEEVKLPIEMPALLGSGAEFIPVGNAYSNEILQIDRIPNEKTLIGYIYGGIESTAENIFFVNDGSQSEATNRIFKVYLNKTSTVGIKGTSLMHEDLIDLQVSPNPTKSKIAQISFNNPSYANSSITIVDLEGRALLTEEVKPQASLSHQLSLDLTELTAGTYFIYLNSNHQVVTKRFILN